MKNQPVSLISPLSNFQKSSPNVPLGSVLANIRSSHEAVFIFENGIFLGLVSPYLTLFQKRYPYLSKLSHCLFNPPHITDNTPLYDVAEYMIFTKIYTLPVFNEKEEIIGVITADSIIKRVMNDPSLAEKIVNLMQINKPITANMHITVKDAYKIMRSHDIGRIILVDNLGKLQGLVSRRDLQEAFIAQTVRQRFTTKVTRRIEPVRSSFDEEEIDRRDSPIMEFATNLVVSAPTDLPLNKAFQKILKSKRHSIVLTKESRPVGFFSRHDILQAISLLKPQKEIPIIWKKPKDALAEYYMNNIYDLLNQFAQRLDKQYPIRKIEVHIDRPRNAAEVEKEFFTTKLHIQLKSGQLLFTVVESWEKDMGIREALSEIERQVDLTDRQKNMKMKPR